MVFIGGGAGMAPMRSHLFDQLKRRALRAQNLLLVRRAFAARDVLRQDDYDMLAQGERQL